MRIGVNCFNLGPAIGGIKQYFLMLFDELLRHDHGNDYVFFWCPDNANELAQLASERWREHAVRSFLLPARRALSATAAAPFRGDAARHPGGVLS
jgi:hypothetical protein